MKRPFLLFSALALCLGAVLGACTPPESSSSAPAAQQDPAQPEAAPAALQMLTPGNSQGRYAVGTVDDGGGQYHNLLVWVDYNSAAASALCAQPNCPHNSDACPAWLGQDNASALILPDGRLLLTRSRWDEGAGASVTTLQLANADGTNPKTLYTTANSIKPGLADDSFLYLEIQDVDAELGSAENALYRLPLAGGEPEQLFGLEMGQNLQDDAGVLGCVGREIVYYAFSWENDGIAWAPPAGATREELEQWQMEADQQAYSGRHHVTAINLDTGAQRELAAWDSQLGSAGYCCKLLGGTLFRLPDNALGDLILTDAATGEEESIAVQWPFDADVHSARISAMVDGRIIADYSAADGNMRRAAIDPATGAAEELTLQYISNGHQLGVNLLGQSPDSLLVLYALQPKDFTAYGPDGNPYAAQTVSHCYAMLGFADFLSSTPGYRSLQVEEGLDLSFS